MYDYKILLKYAKLIVLRCLYDRAKLVVAGVDDAPATCVMKGCIVKLQDKL
jgi:hypothetical protein